MTSVQARSIKDKDLGLKEYHSCENPDVDIIAIPGLGAHPDETWCYGLDSHREASVHGDAHTDDSLCETEQYNDNTYASNWQQWLRETSAVSWLNWLEHEHMLPAAFPTSRIMRYGYRSEWMGKGRIKTRPSLISHHLRPEILAKRSEDPHRPLILISHSYGGLVVAQMLIESMTDPHDDIYNATIGLIFIGVPFRGASDGFTTGIPVLARRKFGDTEVWDDCMQIMQDDGQLTELRKQFCNLSRARGQPSIVCFFEMMATDAAKIVREPDQYETILLCPESSACLDYAFSVPMDRDHFRMNKFPWPGDKNFISMVAQIQDMIDNKHKILSPRRFPAALARLKDTMTDVEFLSKLNSSLVLGKRRHTDTRALFAETTVHNVLILLLHKLQVSPSSLFVDNPELEDTLFKVFSQIKLLIWTLMTLEERLRDKPISSERWDQTSPDDLMSLAIHSTITFEKTKDLLALHEDVGPSSKAKKQEKLDESDLDLLSKDLQWIDNTWNQYQQLLSCAPGEQVHAIGRKLTLRLKSRHPWYTRDMVPRRSFYAIQQLAAEGLSWPASKSQDITKGFTGPPRDDSRNNDERVPPEVQNRIGLPRDISRLSFEEGLRISMSDCRNKYRSSNATLRSSIIASDTASARGSLLSVISRLSHSDHSATLAQEEIGASITDNTAREDVPQSVDDDLKVSVDRDRVSRISRSPSHQALVKTNIALDITDRLCTLLQAQGLVYKGRVIAQPDGAIEIELHGHQLKHLSDDIVRAFNDQVTRLAVGRNPGISFGNMSACKDLTYLNVRRSHLSTFPIELCDIHNLKILDMSYNDLVHLPDDVSRMRALRLIALAHNKMVELTRSLVNLPQLAAINMDHNPLEQNVHFKRWMSDKHKFQDTVSGRAAWIRSCLRVYFSERTDLYIGLDETVYSADSV